MKSSQSDLEYLVELSEGTPPEFLSALSSEDQHQLREYVDSILQRDRAGLDKLFESMSIMMKFIPNLLLHSITPKYIEPSIAARISDKLTVKQALGVTGGLPVEYIGETSTYLDCRHAADILIGLKEKKSEQVLRFMIDKYPLKSLDILEHVPDKFLALAARFFDRNSIDEAGLTTGRRKVLSTLEALKP